MSTWGTFLSYVSCRLFRSQKLQEVSNLPVAVGSRRVKRHAGELRPNGSAERRARRCMSLALYLSRVRSSDLLGRTTLARAPQAREALSATLIDATLTGSDVNSSYERPLRYRTTAHEAKHSARQRTQLPRRVRL